MIPKMPAIGLDPRVDTGFRKGSCSIKILKIRPDRSGNALEGAVAQLGDEKPPRIDRAGHDGAAERHRLESSLAVIRLVADEDDELVPVRGGFLERPFDQRLA